MSIKLASENEVCMKIFVRSRKGNPIKVVRERYLRKDIQCSCIGCENCFLNSPINYNGEKQKPILSLQPPFLKSIGNHYCIPDTNVLVQSIDIFENSTVFFDIIILQTVLDEVQNISLPIYNRLRALTSSSEKRFYVYHNDFSIFTHINSLPNESINDRNDRAIRVSALWYNKHLNENLQNNSIKTIIISNDKENRIKSKNENLICLSLLEYVSQYENSAELIDIVAQNSEKNNNSIMNNNLIKNQLIYQDYYPMSQILGGINSNNIFKGTLNISPYNYLEGSIYSSYLKSRILILGRNHINRAFHDDIVAVELLPKSEWKEESTKIVQEDSNKNDDPDNQSQDINENENENENENKIKIKNNKNEKLLQPTGKVVGLISRNWRSYVGHIDSSSISKSTIKGSRLQSTVLVLPMDKKIPKIRIKTRQAALLIGKRIVVAPDNWSNDSKFPDGHFIRTLGAIEDQNAETEALLLEHDVSYNPFSISVLNCLPQEGNKWVVPQSKDDPLWKDRVDLRDLLVCSIDPIGCQDIDDALHATVLPNGNFQVGVHIADVSHFVKPGTPMDAEAASRGTTVYLVDKRIDMLPSLLGTDLCSLKSDVERFAFSTIWEMTPDAKVVNVKFHKSVIKSKMSFSYEQAQLRIDDNSMQDDLTKSIRILLLLSKKLRAARLQAGALNLASPEVKIQTESETSDPVDVEIKQHLETNSLVEEFMLLANISVAAKIYEAYPQTAMLRRHEAPPETNFDTLKLQLKTICGFDLDITDSKALADSLDKCVIESDPFFNTLVRILATRCMQSAVYFPAGTLQYPQFRHYGLASPIYTHWTSPIRRYADVVAHRQLASAIGYEMLHPTLLEKSRLVKICDNINVRHRNAQNAGRASIEYYVGKSLKGKVEVQEGYIMRIFSNGFVVIIPRFGIEGIINVKSLSIPESDIEFQNEKFRLLFKKGKETVPLTLFDKIKVQIETAYDDNTGKRRVVMKLLEPSL